MAEQKHITVIPASYRAAILDMDGVITRTARVHAAAWKQMFDEFLQGRTGPDGNPQPPFDDETEYYRYVDGKPRYEGVRSFLEARGIFLPHGSPGDPPGNDTICSLGNRKNQYFLDHLEQHGVELFQSTIDFIHHMKSLDKRVAAISASRNARSVLKAAGVLNLFQVIVDGVESEKHHLKGKPEPDIFLEAARRLEVSPEEAIVIEDAQAGVAAGKAGGFGLVIGINSSGDNTELNRYGADMVVGDLSEIEYEGE